MKKEKQTAEQAVTDVPNNQAAVDDSIINEDNVAENEVKEAAEEAAAGETADDEEPEPTTEDAMSRLAAAYKELEQANKSLADAKQALAGQLTRLQADFDN